MKSPLEFEKIEIVGLGLTGALLAHKLESAGKSFKIYDAPMDGRSTIVAPGILNPLAGRKFSPPESIENQWNSAQSFFQDMESKSNLKFWHEMPIHRFFFNESQLKFFEKAQKDDLASKFIGESYPKNSLGSDFFDELGSFETPVGAWADLPKFIEWTKIYFHKKECLSESKATNDYPDSKTLKIYAEGWRAEQNDLWKFIPFNPSKGEMLIIDFEEDLPRDHIYNKSCWLQPLPDSSYWRCGATYNWDEFNGLPSLKAYQTLSSRIKELTPIPFKVVDQLAGVRPIIRDYHPVIGPHPEKDNVYIFNGLGSKGILQGSQLCDTLIYSPESIHENLLVGRFF